VVLVLLSGFTPQLSDAAAIAVYVVAVTTVGSGVDYAWRMNRVVPRSSTPPRPVR
jgi:hypothetical protein